MLAKRVRLVRWAHRDGLLGRHLKMDHERHVAPNRIARPSFVASVERLASWRRRSSVERFTRALGEQVIAAWRRCDLRRTAFADVARDQLTAVQGQSLPSANALLEWAIAGESLPYQQHFDSPFGQPSVTLFWHSQFYIEALFWTSATPAVHNHSFHGAFSVLAGSSLQTTYDFIPHDVVNEQLTLGSVQVRDARVLGVGSVERILPGRDLIHSVFHLDSPSVTLVVRTHSDPNTAGRFEYLIPSVAFDPTIVDQQRTRRLQCLALLAETDPARYVAQAKDLIRGTDFVTVFCVLRQAWGHSGHGIYQAELSADAKIRWGDRIDSLDRAFAEERRRTPGAIRRKVSDRTLRIFVGVLLSQCSRRSIGTVLADNLPDHATPDAIAEMVRQLGAVGALPIDIDELSGRVIAAVISRDACDEASVVAALCGLGGAAGQEIKGRLRELKEVPLLRPMFS